MRTEPIDLNQVAAQRAKQEATMRAGRGQNAYGLLGSLLNGEASRGPVTAARGLELVQIAFQIAEEFLHVSGTRPLPEKST